jgi:hypothetical protein
MTVSRKVSTAFQSQVVDDFWQERGYTGPVCGRIIRMASQMPDHPADQAVERKDRLGVILS